jgi:hypothetical protein
MKAITCTDDEQKAATAGGRIHNGEHSSSHLTLDYLF